MSAGEMILVIILGCIAGGIIGFIVHVLFAGIDKVWNWLKGLISPKKQKKNYRFHYEDDDIDIRF